MAKKPKSELAPEPVADAPVMGRPSSYLPEYTKITAALCYGGATDAELADCFGVTERTVNRWKITHPEFADACKAGKDEPDERVQRSLFHRAMGIEYERAHPVKLKKITYDETGKKKLMEEERVEIVMIKEIIPPDTTAMIFWLKNRRAQQWRDVHKHEHGKAGDFDQMSEEELTEFITVEAQQLLPAPEPQTAPKRGRSATKH